MSHDPPQIQIPQKWTFKQGKDTKSVRFFSAHCISCTINTVNGQQTIFSSLCAFVV